MRKMWLIFAILSLWSAFSMYQSIIKHKKYHLVQEPIDVIIPAIDKDLDTLNLCIAGIKANCAQIRRVIVVSAKPLTDQAEWFDESVYPFSKKECALELMKGNEEATQDLMSHSSRVGWYYQQLLKFYAPFVIPGISSNVLVLDADTIFLNSVEFINSHSEGLYNPSNENHQPYFDHAQKLLPTLQRKFLKYSGISHHMLFQKDVLTHLFKKVEKHHHMPFWKAFCQCVDLEKISGSGASEYEIYFNFVFGTSKQPHVRILKWKNVSDIDHLPQQKAQGYHYVTSHAYVRNKK